MIPETRVQVLFAVLEFSDRMLGGTRSLSLILHHLKRIDAEVISFREGEFTDSLRAAGSRVDVPLNIRDNLFERFRSRPLRDRWNLFLQIIRSNRHIYSLMRKRKLKVLHCNSIFDFVFCFAGAKLAGSRILFNVRGTHPEMKMRWHWQLPILLSSRIVVLSREINDYYVSSIWRLFRSRAAKKFAVIYSGVPHEELIPYEGQGREFFRRSLGLPADAFIVNYIGSVRPLKMQLEFLRRVVAPSVEQIPNIYFCFAGEPLVTDSDSLEYWKACMAEAERFDAGQHVLFAGHQKNIYPWYFASDVSAMAYKEEGLPRVMIESMACGTPVIATDFTSAREVLEQYGCGIVVKQGEWEGIIRGLMRLYSDHKLRTDMGLNGLKAARKLFDLDSTVEQYEQLYCALASPGAK